MVGFGVYALFAGVMTMAALLPEKPSLILAIFGLIFATGVMLYVIFVIAQYFRPSNVKGDKYGASGEKAETQKVNRFVLQEYVPQAYVPQAFTPQPYQPPQ